MKLRRQRSAIALLIALAGCAPSSIGMSPTIAEPSESIAAPVSAQPTVAVRPSVAPSAPTTQFPTAAFAGLGDELVSAALAADLQSILDAAPDGHGLTAAVISPHGTWNGATGMATTERAMVPDDQFAIASVTKSLVAAQVMQMVDDGDLGLDDPAADHLPPDLDFDTNGATLRELLEHRSGLPGYDPQLFDPGRQESPPGDRQRVWTPAEMLGMVLADRKPPGKTFEYTNTNYLLLGLVIEQVRTQPLAEVMRSGVLDIDGIDRLIYQPDEVPTEPMAMPFGESTDVLEEGGGFLPSLAAATSDGAAAAMASDSPSLARWWRAFCAGEIVSQASLTEMTTMHDGYGLGLYRPDPPGMVGHSGEHIGYMALAGCLPKDGVVVVVLSNDVGVDLSAIAGPLVDAVRRE